MQQRGRQSSASLSVVAGSIDGRPKAPDGLTDEQQEIWNRVVASESSDFFKTAAVQQQLARYCVHLAEVAWLDGEIADAKLPSAGSSLADIDRMMKMRDREDRACVTLATKLRLTNQSRYRADKVHPTPNSGGGERKLWQRA
jgi:hypothetical protein